MGGIVMPKEEYNVMITPHERAKAIQSFFKFGRKFPGIGQFVKGTIQFHNFFDMQEILLKKLDFTDFEKTIDWINVALDDIAVSRVLYKNKDGLSLYHLSQGIEKLFKACLIFTGFKKEVNVTSMNHKPQKFLIEIFEDEEIGSVMFDKFPIKGVKRPVRPEDKKLEELKSIIRTPDKIEALNKGDEFVKMVSMLLGAPSPLVYEPNEFKEMMKEFMETICPPKELKRFIEECNRGPISYDDILYQVSNYVYISINMAMFLLPLSIGTWAFQSVPRYPDELRKMEGKKFDEYHTHIAFYLIIDKIEKFGEFFKKYVESMK
jgi:hypothetical protein